MKLRSTPLFISVLISTTLFSQVQNYTTTKRETLKALANKTLVVELPEPNPKVMKSWSGEKLEGYLASLDSYRKEIEPAVRKYWTFNKNIEFKTTSELIDLFVKKDTNYVALVKAELVQTGSGGALVEIGSKTFIDYGLPGFKLVQTARSKGWNEGKGEMRLFGSDLRSFVPVVYEEEDKKAYAELYTEANMGLGVQLMQDFLIWCIEVNEGPQRFEKFLKDMVAKNCLELGKKELLVPNGTLTSKLTEAKASDKYGRPVSFVPRSEVEAAYMNGTSEKLVLFSLKFDVHNTLGHKYLRIVVDPSSNKVLGAAIPGKMMYYSGTMIGKEMRSLGECD